MVQSLVCSLCLQICYCFGSAYFMNILLRNRFCCINLPILSFDIPNMIEYLTITLVWKGLLSCSENDFIIPNCTMSSIYMLFIIQSKFGLHFFYFFFLFVCVHLLESLCRLIVKYHKVTIADIEP